MAHGFGKQINGIEKQFYLDYRQVPLNLVVVWPVGRLPIMLYRPVTGCGSKPSNAVNQMQISNFWSPGSGRPREPGRGTEP